MTSTKDTIAIVSKNLDAAARQTLDYARSKRADRAKISASCNVEKRLVIENKEFSLANTLESQKISLAVHKDQKKGSASLNSYQESGLRGCVDDALALANFSMPDEFLIMPSIDEAPPSKPLPFMWNDRAAEIGLNELQELSQAMLAKLTRDKRVALDRVEVSSHAMWHGLYNSLGVEQFERQTAVSWSIMGMAVDGNEVSGFDGDGQSGYNIEDAYKYALEQCDEFTLRIIQNLRPIKSPSYHGCILLTPRAVEEILFGTILYHAAGSSVMDGKSLWGDRVKSKVISDLITITDDPHSKQFSGATAFDGDGLPTSPQTLIQNGVLLTHLHDCYTAKRCKTKSTATAGGPFGLTLKAGTTPLSDMNSARKDLLVVDRFAGNIDSIKGDFSGVVKTSRLLRDGKDVGAVAETMIAGNIFDCLNNILAVSQEFKIVSGSANLPWILLDGVSVSSP